MTHNHLLFNKLGREIGIVLAARQMNETDTRKCWGIHIYLIEIYLHLGIVI